MKIDLNDADLASLARDAIGKGQIQLRPSLEILLSEYFDHESIYRIEFDQDKNQFSMISNEDGKLLVSIGAYQNMNGTIDKDRSILSLFHFAITYLSEGKQSE